MPDQVNQRVQKRRDAMRIAGLRPVQLWVPDTRRAGFSAKCHRQCVLVTQADSADEGIDALMDEAVKDIDGWTS